MDSSDEDIWDYKSLSRIRTSQGSKNSSSSSSTNATKASSKHKGNQRGKLALSQPAFKKSSNSSDFRKETLKKVSSTQAGPTRSTHQSGKSVIKKEPSTARQKSNEKARKRKKSPLVKTETEVTPAKCRKTGSGPSSAEREGRCPICQVPYRVLSAIMTPSWHLDECQMDVVKKKEECPLGLSCDVMFESHYKKYRHTQIARSSKKKLAQSSQQQYGSVDKARVSLKFGDAMNLASTIQSLAETVIVLSSGTEEESQGTSNENRATASVADNSIDDDDINITHLQGTSRENRATASVADNINDDDDINITHVKNRNRSMNELFEDDDYDINITHIKKRNRSKNDIFEDDDDDDDSSRQVKDKHIKLRTTVDVEASDVDSEFELDKTVVPHESRQVTDRHCNSTNKLPSPTYVQYDSDIAVYTESFDDLVSNTRSSVGSVHNIDSSDDENRNVSDMLQDVLYENRPVNAEDRLASGKPNLFDDIFSADSEGSGSVEPMQDKSVKKRSRDYSIDTEVDEHDSDIEEMDTLELVRNIVQDIDCDIDGTGDAGSKTGQAFAAERRSSSMFRQDSDENEGECHKNTKAGVYSSLIYDTVKHRRCRKDNLPHVTEKCKTNRRIVSSDDDSLSSEELYHSPFKPDTFVDAPGRHQAHKAKENIHHDAVAIKKEKNCAESNKNIGQNKTKDLKSV